MNQTKLLTYSVSLAYNGAPFCGFAKQPGQLTVQGELERALSLVFKSQVETTCAGRTDAGVHARNQVVSFELPDTALVGRTTHNILRSLNALTAEGISIRNFEERPCGFSARFDAKMREYRYFIYPHAAPPIFMDAFSWHISVRDGLNTNAMHEASRYLIGEHDFKSFCLACSAEGRSTSRYVESIEFFSENILEKELLVVKIKGNAFLHSMVRAIVGTLVAVGKDKRDPKWVKAALDACDRRAAGENAPAQGLVLWDVVY